MLIVSRSADSASFLVASSHYDRLMPCASFLLICCIVYQGISTCVDAAALPQVRVTSCDDFGGLVLSQPSVINITGIGGTFAAAACNATVHMANVSRLVFSANTSSLSLRLVASPSATDPTYYFSFQDVPSCSAGVFVAANTFHVDLHIFINVSNLVVLGRCPWLQLSNGVELWRPHFTLANAKMNVSQTIVSLDDGKLIVNGTFSLLDANVVVKLSDNGLLGVTSAALFITLPQRNLNTTVVVSNVTAAGSFGCVRQLSCEYCSPAHADANYVSVLVAHTSIIVPTADTTAFASPLISLQTRLLNSAYHIYLRYCSFEAPRRTVAVNVEGSSTVGIYVANSSMATGGLLFLNSIVQVTSHVVVAVRSSRLNFTTIYGKPLELQVSPSLSRVAVTFDEVNLTWVVHRASHTTVAFLQVVVSATESDFLDFATLSSVSVSLTRCSMNVTMLSALQWDAVGYAIPFRPVFVVAVMCKTTTNMLFDFFRKERCAAASLEVFFSTTTLTVLGAGELRVIAVTNISPAITSLSANGCSAAAQTPNTSLSIFDVDLSQPAHVQRVVVANRLTVLVTVSSMSAGGASALSFLRMQDATSLQPLVETVNVFVSECTAHVYGDSRNSITIIEDSRPRSLAFQATLTVVDLHVVGLGTANFTKPMIGVCSAVHSTFISLQQLRFRIRNINITASNAGGALLIGLFLVGENTTQRIISLSVIDAALPVLDTQKLVGTATAVPLVSVVSAAAQAFSDTAAMVLFRNLFVTSDVVLLSAPFALLWTSIRVECVYQNWRAVKSGSLSDVLSGANSTEFHIVDECTSTLTASLTQGVLSLSRSNTHTSNGWTTASHRSTTTLSSAMPTTMSLPPSTTDSVVVVELHPTLLSSAVLMSSAGAVAVALSSLVSGGIALDGGAFAAVTSVDCVDALDKKAASPLRFMMSPFVDEGGGAMVVGNLGIVALVFVVQLIGVAVAAKVCSPETPSDIVASQRFPQLTLFAGVFLLPGTVRGAVSVLAGGEWSPLEICSWVLFPFALYGFVLVWRHCLQWVYVNATYGALQGGVGSALRQSLGAVGYAVLAPVGQWSPASATRRFGCVFAAARGPQHVPFLWHYILHCSVVSMLSAVPFPQRFCYLQMIFLAALFVGLTAYCAVHRPYRSPLVTWITAFSFLCIAVVSLVLGLNSMNPFPETSDRVVMIVTMLQSCAMLLRLVHVAFQRYFEFSAGKKLLTRLPDHQKRQKDETVLAAAVSFCELIKGVFASDEDSNQLVSKKQRDPRGQAFQPSRVSTVLLGHLENLHLRIVQSRCSGKPFVFGPRHQRQQLFLLVRAITAQRVDSAERERNL